MVGRTRLWGAVTCSVYRGASGQHTTRKRSTESCVHPRVYSKGCQLYYVLFWAQEQTTTPPSQEVGGFYKTEVSGAQYSHAPDFRVAFPHSRSVEPVIESVPMCQPTLFCWVALLFENHSISIIVSVTVKADILMANKLAILTLSILHQNKYKIHTQRPQVCSPAFTPSSAHLKRV